jgi:hypothetical protein
MFGQSTTDSYTYNYVSFTALADGGQLSAFFSLCCPVYAKWAGLF